jgi:hypothetical protein
MAVMAHVIPLETEDARRVGGAMGQLHGPGYDGLGDQQTRLALPPSLYGRDETAAPAKRPVVRLRVRWESALPVRAAEMKIPESGTPIAFDDGYCIAVYNLPGTYFGDPKRLGDHLKGMALIRREGKRDVRASNAEVYQLDSGVAVFYVFPHSANISAVDRVVEFDAQIGRLAISQFFHLEEMQIQGSLAL